MRKNRVQKQERYLQAARFRWEFLRRNKKFIKDFAWFENYDPAYLACNHSDKKYLCKAKSFAAKWGLRFSKTLILNVLVTLDHLEKDVFNAAMDLKPDIFGNAINPPFDEILDNLDYLSETNISAFKKALKKINLTIDVTKPREILDLELDFIFDWLQNLYKNKKINIGRTQFKQYEHYLKVYDLFERVLDPKTVVKEMYPTLFNNPDANFDNIRAAIQQVNRNYDAAKRLVDRGYKNIF